MTLTEKEKLIAEIIAILQLKIKADTLVEMKQQDSSVSQHLEMLTIKECTQVIKGISEHTIRLLVNQNKIPCIRTGEGKRGKILVSKDALMKYFHS